MVDILAPVFLVIALGWVLVDRGFLSGRALADVNRLSYWIGLPSLLVYRIAGANPDVAAVAGLLAVTIGATLLLIVGGFLAAWLLPMPAGLRGTFVQGVFRGNLAFIGLPVVLYSFAGSGAAGVESSALLAFGPLVVLYNVVSVLVLLLPTSGERLGVLRSAAMGLVTNPILIACLLGLVLAWWGIALPLMIERSLSAIGQMALPLALLCIGGTLRLSRLRGRLGWALVGAVMKTWLLPALGLFLAWGLALSEEHTRIALLLLACPTASASYVLVMQLRGDAALASSMIVLSTALAVPAMMVILAITG